MPQGSINDLINDLVPVDEVDRFADPTEARRKAMDLLARREHAFDELCRKLQSKGFDADVTLQAIDRLREEGLQCDQRFVESFVQSRINQGKGPAKIRAELSRKGVREALVEAALSAADTDWDMLAREVRERKFGRSVPTDFKDKARQMRFLQYRGFEAGAIRSAVSGVDE